MAELKTKKNNGSVTDFLNKIEDETKRNDCFTILKLMEDATSKKALMWGDAIIGLDSYSYSRKGSKNCVMEWFKIGFSPRKQNIVLYLAIYLDDFSELLSKLGKHKMGKGCVYINKLSDINIDILQDIISASLINFKKQSKIYNKFTVYSIIVL